MCVVSITLAEDRPLREDVVVKDDGELFLSSCPHQVSPWKLDGAKARQVRQLSQKRVSFALGAPKLQPVALPMYFARPPCSSRDKSPETDFPRIASPLRHQLESANKIS